MTQDSSGGGEVDLSLPSSHPQRLPSLHSQGAGKLGTSSLPASAGRGQPPRSARSAQRRDMDLGPMHPREEEIIRGVYQKHAHVFFDDMKEVFTREAVALRTQAAKLLAKAAGSAKFSDPALPASASEVGSGTPGTMSHSASSALVGVGDDSSEGTTQLLEQLRKEVSELRQKDGPGRAPDADVLKSVEEKLVKHQNDLDAISKHLRSEANAAKRATLTPVWKENALRDIATRELRVVCIDEVHKAFDSVTSTFLKNEVEPRVTKQVEAVVPKVLDTAISEMRIEVSQLKQELSKLSQQDAMISDLSCRHEDLKAQLDSEVKRLSSGAGKPSSDVGYALKVDVDEIKRLLAEQSKAGHDSTEDAYKAQSEALEHRLMSLVNSHIEDLKTQHNALQKECLDINTTASLISTVAIEDAKNTLQKLDERVASMEKAGGGAALNTDQLFVAWCNLQDEDLQKENPVKNQAENDTEKPVKGVLKTSENQ